MVVRARKRRFCKNSMTEQDIIVAHVNSQWPGLTTCRKNFTRPNQPKFTIERTGYQGALILSNLWELLVSGGSCCYLQRWGTSKAT